MKRGVEKKSIPSPCLVVALAFHKRAIFPETRYSTASGSHSWILKRQVFSRGPKRG